MRGVSAIQRLVSPAVSVSVRLPLPLAADSLPSSYSRAEEGCSYSSSQHTQSSFHSHRLRPCLSSHCYRSFRVCFFNGTKRLGANPSRAWTFGEVGNLTIPEQMGSLPGLPAGRAGKAVKFRTPPRSQCSLGARLGDSGSIPVISLGGKKRLLQPRCS